MILKNYFNLFMDKIFYTKTIDKLSNSEFSDYIENMKNGIPIATPVFDGAKEKDVTNMLKIAGLPEIWSNLFMGWKNR